MPSWGQALGLAGRPGRVKHAAKQALPYILDPAAAERLGEAYGTWVKAAESWHAAMPNCVKSSMYFLQTRENRAVHICLMALDNLQKE